MDSVALAFVLLAGGFQEDKDHKSFLITKQERSSYVPALQRFRDAEKLQSDPLECAKRCGELLEDKAIRAEVWDSMIRIQNTDGSYGDWALFAPYQLRGRALLARAEALTRADRREAAKQARLAVADLDESFRRGLKSSGELLDRARKLSLQLKDAEGVPDERLAEAERIIRKEALQARWTGLVIEGKFRSARAAVASLGGFLTEGERQEMLAQIDGKSHDAARRFHASLRDLLPDQETWAAFAGVPVADLERRLVLPPAEELDAADGGLAWARRCRDWLLQTRTKTDLPAAPTDDFLAALKRAAQTCVEAAGQVRDGENRAFAGLEALVQDLALGRLEKNLSGAFTEEPEGLARRRDEGRRIIEAMQAFAAALEKDPGAAPIVSKHLSQLRSIPDRMPIDPARLDEIGRQLLDPSNPKGLWGRTSALTIEYESELSALDRAPDSRLSKSARRKLCTYLLVAGVSRLLLTGERAEVVARREELKTLARKLDLDGGPLPDVLKLISPRVRAVLDRLKS